MSSSTSNKTSSSSPREASRPAATPELRIDPPHAIRTTREEESLEETQEVDLAAADLQQLPDFQRRQINQLARLLRERQVELDRREAELNARLAEFETQQRSAALALAEQMDAFEQTPPPPQPKGAPQSESSTRTLRALDEKIRSWRRKWRGQRTHEATAPPAETPLDGVAVRLEKLTDAEAQLAQQWALLKNARSLQALREKEFAGYAQKIERELEQSRAQHHQWLEQEQEQIARQQEDLERRESELAEIQTQLEHSLGELQQIRDQLELAWSEIRVRIPSALRRRLDQQVRQPIEATDRSIAHRNQVTKAEIHELLNQLELAKLQIQEEQVQLEDETQRLQGELRRAKHELRDRETLVHAQLAELRREHEALNETKLELLKQRYHDLTCEITPRT